MAGRRPVPQAVLAVVLIGFLAGSQPASAASTTVRVGPNVNVSRLAGNQAETTIAANPANPSNLVIVSNEVGSALFEAYSFDGGLSWTRHDIAAGTDALQIACCDPSLAFDSYGNLFLIYLDAKAHDVEAALSTDGGITFRPLGAVEATSVTASTGPGNKSGGSVDQPTVTTGPGSVWVTYKLFAKHQLLRARGAPVTGLGKVGPWQAPQDVPGSKLGSFGDIAVGPSGQVMVTYQDGLSGQGPASIWVNVDPDGLGPGGFGPAIRATGTNVGGFDFIPPQPDRSVDAEAGLAWNRSGRAHAGRVYLVYTEENPNESNNTDILVRHSDDQGQTWSAPIRVNDDSGVNSQFNPHIAVDQTTGHIAVSFYDARNDLGTGSPSDTDGVPNTDAQYGGAVSTDGGSSFAPNVQISAGSSHVQSSGSGVDYGDYNGMAFDAGVFHPAWADNSNSTGDNPDGALHALDIYTASVSA